MRIRTEFSFKAAYGKINQVHKKLSDLNWPAMPISDRMSTFGYAKWDKLCAKAEKRPVFGVEIGVSANIGDRRPSVAYWSFFAQNDIKSINELIALATKSVSSEPLLTYEQACSAEGVLIIGDHRTKLEHMIPKSKEKIMFALSPSTSVGFYNAARDAEYDFVASPDNYYIDESNKEEYRVMLGRAANSQTYPMHLVTDAEWYESVNHIIDLKTSISFLKRRDLMLGFCNATLAKARLFKPERVQTLFEMCIEGAATKNCDLTDPVYKERLERELSLIQSKDFEDYFFIVAEMMQWAKQRMICGPARGSSAGSLVCYLLDITAIDPIPFGLIFERFIDITRADLPDIDLDFSDVNRHLVFEHMEQTYGKERVARLGTVTNFKPRSILKIGGANLLIPKWMCDKVADALIERSSGDSRALNTLEDTIAEGEMGRKMLYEYPQVKLTFNSEGHANNSGQHAAGIIITDEDASKYVAIDSRSGVAMCDKYDAEHLGMLKIDALGLTQLSVFEQTLRLIGVAPTGQFLDEIPLDDEAAFEILNQKKFAGVFQANGKSLQILFNEITVDCFDDYAAVTAAARPGAVASGGAVRWARKRSGKNPISYHHECIKSYVEATYGEILYQEQILMICKDIGEMDWADVTAIRKAMSKSLGEEFFDRYGDKFKLGAAKHDFTGASVDDFWKQLIAYGSWCLAEGTEVKLAYTKSPIKIETLWEYYQDKNLVNSFGRHELISRDECGKDFNQHIHDVTCNGIKHCYKFTFSDGTSVTCTKDHVFFCDMKEFRAGDADIGSLWDALGGYGANKFFSYKSLISVEDVGMKMTYDISMPKRHNYMLENGIITHNSFNKSHAVAYGLITYWCTWLKAHHPVEFAAATLDSESDSMRQLQLLRELNEEGITYTPVDVDYSVDRWNIKVQQNEKKILVGPLTSIKGIGPAGVATIMRCRSTGEALPPGLKKKLEEARTSIDSLNPVADAVKRLHPDLTKINIHSDPTEIIHLDKGDRGEFMIIAMVSKIQPRNENDSQSVAKRKGKLVSGQPWSLNMFMRDDTDEILCKIDRKDYERLAHTIIERGGQGKAIYAIKGTLPSGFRMILITQIRFIGMVDEHRTVDLLF